MTICVIHAFFFFFFKQKTAYEMRISDWSSDVCSSDLFAMVAEGLEEVANPSALFLTHRDENVTGATVFPALEGTRPVLVEIQALVEIGRASCRERVCQYV